MLETIEVIVILFMGAAIPLYRLWRAQQTIKALEEELEDQRRRWRKSLRTSEGVGATSHAESTDTAFTQTNS